MVPYPAPPQKDDLKIWVKSIGDVVVDVGDLELGSAANVLDGTTLDASRVEYLSKLESIKDDSVGNDDRIFAEV